MTNRRTALLAASALALGLSACSKKPPAQLPPAPGETQAATPEDPTATGAPQPGTQEHFTGQVGIENTVVYFDTDRYDIDGEDGGKLSAQARYFAQNPSVTFTIEGHADERGTREYNLALGERRANSAKNYLVGLGVSESRIRTVSYGKERPVALDSSEDAWARNRRAATVVVN